jgi:hypothetical protein
MSFPTRRQGDANLIFGNEIELEGMMKFLATRGLILSALILIQPFPALAVEVQDNKRYSLSPTDIATLLEIAHQSVPWTIERISTAQLFHPLGPWGAVISFKPQVIGTYEISRSLRLMNREWSPAYKGITEASSSIQSTTWVPFDKGLISTIRRIFILGEMTVRVSLPDTLSYEIAKAFLQDLSENRFERANTSLPESIEIEKLNCMEFVSKVNELRLTFGRGDWSWDEYVFKVDGDQLILVEIEHYQA